MSTRARIVIEDASSGRRNYLYRGFDGYLSGLGDDLVVACDANANAPDVDSFTFKLLKSKCGLETDVFGEDACLDWVYTIEWNPVEIMIFAQAVDWEGDVRIPSAKRLKDRVNVREYVDDYREKERQRRLFVENLKRRCGPCPLCGAEPDLFVSGDRDLLRVRCMNWRCAKRTEIETASEDELVTAWHRVSVGNP